MKRENIVLKIIKKIIVLLLKKIQKSRYKRINEN